MLEVVREIPKISDLPPARLRIHKPTFYSTGVDSFSPYMVKIGSHNEKRWVIAFKCMTTQAVILDLLSSIDSDFFMMALRCFVARRGMPFKLLSGQDTNFIGRENGS